MSGTPYKRQLMAIALLDRMKMEGIVVSISESDHLILTPPPKDVTAMRDVVIYGKELKELVRK